MAEAAGRWIAVLDADDWYDVQRLEKLIATGEAQDVDLVADNQFFFDDGANRIVRPALPPGGADRRLTRKVFAAGCDPYAEFDFGMLKPVVRADFVRRTGLRYRESARLSEDFFFMTEFLAAGGRALLVAEPLYYWRQAFGSLSAAGPIPGPEAGDMISPRRWRPTTSCCTNCGAAGNRFWRVC